MSTKFFKCRISKIEERFERRYKKGSLEDAKTESRVEYDEVSIGWFVSFDGWGVALKWGDVKPLDIEQGDVMIIAMQKRIAPTDYMTCEDRIPPKPTVQWDWTIGFREWWKGGWT